MPYVLTFLTFVFVLLNINIKKTDHDFNKYYEEFIQITKKECDKIEKPSRLSINFSNLTEDQIGLCIIFPLKKHILIDSRYWNKATEQQKKQLIFHELTHCVLHYNHVDNIFNYMNPYIIELPDYVLTEQTKEYARLYCNE